MLLQSMVVVALAVTVREEVLLRLAVTMVDVLLRMAVVVADILLRTAVAMEDVRLQMAVAVVEVLLQMAVTTVDVLPRQVVAERIARLHRRAPRPRHLRRLFRPQFLHPPRLPALKPQSLRRTAWLPALLQASHPQRRRTATRPVATAPYQVAPLLEPQQHLKLP